MRTSFPGFPIPAYPVKKQEEMTTPPKFGMFSARRALSPDSARVANDLINSRRPAQEIADTVNFTRTDDGQVLPNANADLANWRRTHYLYPINPEPYTADHVRDHRSNQPSTSANSYTASSSSLQAPLQTFLHQPTQPSTLENPFSIATSGPGSGRLSPLSEALVRRYANASQTDQALMSLVNNTRQGKGFKSNQDYQDFLNKNSEQKTRSQWGIGQYSLKEVATARQAVRQQTLNYSHPQPASIYYPTSSQGNRMKNQLACRI